MNYANALKDKKILFLCPSFFNYEKQIKKTLESLGASVFFFDERPSNTVVSKALLRINRNLVQNQIASYYSNILEKIKKQNFDYILVCQAEATPIFFLKELVVLFPETKKCLYLWDSVENKANTLEKIPYFDKVFSFDWRDCQKYGFSFRPLFYDKEYASSNLNNENNYLYDLFFVGTVHSDRYQLLESIKEQFELRGKNIYYYYYLPTKVLFYFKKYFDKTLKNSHKKDFHFVGLPKEILLEKLRNSKSVIDIQHPGQTGLTMRTIEMLGSEKKLITTNQDIKHYDFYHPDNICIIDRKNVKIDSSFLEVDYHPISTDVKERYSIEFFLLELLMQVEEEQTYYED